MERRLFQARVSIFVKRESFGRFNRFAITILHLYRMWDGHKLLSTTSFLQNWKAADSIRHRQPTSSSYVEDSILIYMVCLPVPSRWMHLLTMIRPMHIRDWWISCLPAHVTVNVGGSIGWTSFDSRRQRGSNTIEPSPVPGDFATM